MNMRERYNTWITAYELGGGNVRVLTTPCCQKELTVPVPKAHHEQWDSLMVCPFCRRLFMKVAHHDRAEGVVP